MQVRDNPEALIPILESATKKVYQNNYHETIRESVTEPVPNWQVQIYSDENPKCLRDMNSKMVGKLVVVPGIITSASRTSIKATSITWKCSACDHTYAQDLKFGFGGAQARRQCANAQNPLPDQRSRCPLDPYKIVSEKCKFLDQQSLKLQEAPEMIPTGEMPRTFVVTVDRELTDKLTPGNRVKLVGILGIIAQQTGGAGASGQSNKGVNKSYIRALGLQSELNKDGGPSTTGFAMPTITAEDEEQITTMARDPEIYDKLTKSMASTIYGHPDIKKAICCLLFGGSPKKLPDGMKLRGDINVLLLGDPSVAKSQFLKFVERVAPIAVYTSGKGSSAAGLTAAVIKDNATGEFQLEGGAMVLADGGVVCIDEFDKMRPQDRVAIHEAMEQQTISIAKAGITTILNSRASVLAAANPLYGRYDDLKHASEQIDFQSSILSRFDAIFIVRDQRLAELDKKIASHVVNLHMNKISAET